MALKGYFIQATFEDGTEVSAYAAYDGTWYYFYTDRRFRFTLTSAGAVDIQQYQPIGSNMAWYDIDIITAVSVEQFDPDNSGGGGTVPEDVYTKEEVNQLIAAAVQEIEAQIPALVAQAVQEALAGLDDRYVLKSGDTMTGQLKLVYDNSTMSVASTGIRVWDTTDQSNLGNATIRVNIGGGYINLFNGTHDYMASVHANNKIMHLSRYNPETNGYTYESRMTNTFWMLNDIDNGTQPVYLGYNVNGSFLYIRDPDNSCYTYISNDDMQMKVGSSNRIWIRNTTDEGAFIAYDNDGNNTWYQPTQISAWTNGGTSQSLITPGADAISFNKTVQVPTNGSFLVSGRCRYAGTLINRYGGELQLQFNDQSRITFNDYGSYTGITILNEGRLYCRRGSGISSSEDSTFGYNGVWLCGPIYHYGNSANENAKYYAYSGTGASFQLMGTMDASTPALGGLQLSGHNGLRITSGSNNQLSIYGAGGNELVMSDGNIYLRAGNAGSTSVVGRIFIRDYFTRQYATALLSNQIALSAYISSMLSTSGSPSTTNINIISLGLIDALNDVINHIQDSIGTNYSASYSSGFLAGGGQARGGGVGRGY